MGLLQVLLTVAALLSGTGATTPPHGQTGAPPATALHGTWPIQPHHVVRGFEPPSDAWTAGHRGVDLEAAVGTPVVASLDGTVAFVSLIAGRGVVVISHGDTRTTYEPVIATVALGQAINGGDRIGFLDVTESHCFPAACLHWGWIRGDEYLDPLQLVAFRAPVRLLPLTRADAPAGRPS